MIFDICLTFLHLALIFFNLFGWIWRKTRKVHLIIVILTAGSWFVLGIWYGWGYCLLADWHWAVKEKLGETNLPDSFIKYMGDNITGMDLNPLIVKMVTLAVFLAVVLVTVYVNFFRKKV